MSAFSGWLERFIFGHRGLLIGAFAVITALMLLYGDRKSVV